MPQRVFVGICSYQSQRSTQMAAYSFPFFKQRHKKEPTCLKLLGVADGSGRQDPKQQQAPRNISPDPSTSVLPLQRPRAGGKIFLSWPQHHPPCNQQQGKRRLCGRPRCLPAGELREGAGVGGWLVAVTVLKGRLCELAWQPGQQPGWLLCLGPILQRKQAGWERINPRH